MVHLWATILTDVTSKGDAPILRRSSNTYHMSVDLRKDLISQLILLNGKLQNKCKLLVQSSVEDPLPSVTKASHIRSFPPSFSEPLRKIDKEITEMLKKVGTLEDKLCKLSDNPKVATSETNGFTLDTEMMNTQQVSSSMSYFSTFPNNLLDSETDGSSAHLADHNLPPRSSQSSNVFQFNLNETYPNAELVHSETPIGRVENLDFDLDLEIGNYGGPSSPEVINLDQEDLGDKVDTGCAREFGVPLVDEPACCEIPLDTTRNRVLAEQLEYPWTPELLYKLRNVFLIENFRCNQLEAINSTLAGKDVFVLMPTGGGKFLCYQLPAIIQSGQKKNGVTIVISPLVSLMNDQVQHLLDLNIKAANLNSGLTTKQRRFVFQLLTNADLDLIYVSPEMVGVSQQFKSAIQSLYRTNKLSRIVIDEAHCVSSWGHDFRPEYKQLAWFKETFPDIPVMALTATANDTVTSDIINSLRLNLDNKLVVLKQSFNRENLFYQVLPKKENFDTLVAKLHDIILTCFPRQSGIIYCHSRNSCEKLAAKLKASGVKCSFYHAGMSPGERFTVQNMWQRNKLQVICATVAFGMGIDKPDVRFVIHFTVPRSLEGYYQETGRAGRDGKYSYCLLFYSFADVRKLQKMIQIDKSISKRNKSRQLEKLQMVMTYCETGNLCRREFLLNYFNEKFDPRLCLCNCDNCDKNHSKEEKIFPSQSVEETDITDTSLEIITLIQTLQEEKVTAVTCQDIFKGSKSTKIVQAGYGELPQYSTGKQYRKIDLERIFFHLITQNILQEYAVINKGGFVASYIKLGPKAKTVLSGKLRVSMIFANTISAVRGEERIGTNEGTNSFLETCSFVKVLKRRKASCTDSPILFRDKDTLLNEDFFQKVLQKYKPNIETDDTYIIEGLRKHLDGAGGGQKGSATVRQRSMLPLGAVRRNTRRVPKCGYKRRKKVCSI